MTGMPAEVREIVSGVEADIAREVIAGRDGLLLLEQRAPWVAADDRPAVLRRLLARHLGCRVRDLDHVLVERAGQLGLWRAA